MTTRDDRYADPHGPGGSRDDRASARLVGDLERLHAATLPSRHDRAIADLLRERVRAGNTPATRRGSVTRWRRRAIVGMVICAAILGGAVYASGNPPSLTGQAMVYAPGQQQVLQRYGYKVSAAGHACGYTLRVTRAYADANRVSVLYTLTGPAGRHFISTGADMPTLADAADPAQPIKNLTLGSSRDTIGATQGLYAAFNAHIIARHARALRLRLTLPAPTMTEQVGIFGWGATSAPCESYGPGGDYGNGLLPFLTATHTRRVMLHKPLTVAFTVPVDPARRVVTPRQTVVAGGVGLVLDHMVVTRSEARVYLRRTRPGHILENANMTLSVGGHRYGGDPLFGDYWVRVAPATRLYDFAFEGPLYDSHGVWTLTIQPIPPDTFTTVAGRKLAGGPWTFRFRVP